MLCQLVGQVLASLPELDDHQGLSRLGSLQSIPSSIPEPEQQFVDSLLTGEKHAAEKGDVRAAADEHHPPPGPPHPQFKRRNPQRGMHSGQQGGGSGSQSFAFGKQPVGPWKMGRPVDGIYDGHQFDKYMAGQILDLGGAYQRPTTLSLRPAFDGTLPPQNELVPPQPGPGVSYADLAKPEEDVQSTLRSSMGPFQSPSHVDPGLESVFSFNYDQPRSTINALLPAAMGYGGPNTELGFSDILRGKANDGYRPA